MIAVRVSGDPDAANNGIFYFHSDHLGSVHVLTKHSDGYIVGESTMRYLPFGGFRSGPNHDLSDRSFTGHKHNNSIGLIYMNARFFVPEIGRFATADTLVPDPTNPQSYNRYAYVLNSPINLSDPSGHICFSASESGIGDGCLGSGGTASGTRPITNTSDEYSDWFSSPNYSGCFKCHAAVANGQVALTNRELSLIDYQMRQAGFNVARIIEPIDWTAQILECANDPCNPEQVYFMTLPFMSGGMYDDFYRFTNEFDELVSARSIRYTQDNIGTSTRDGLFLDDLIGSMSAYGWRGDALNVVEVDEVLYSLDHRRLVAAQHLGIDVPVNILDLSNPSVAAEFLRKSSGLRTGTQGLYIDIRGTGIRLNTDGSIIWR